jgi:hypothetical protein
MQQLRNPQMKNLRSQINIRRIFGAFIFFAAFGVAPAVYAGDAAIFLSPITSTYTTGDSFTLSVMVGSGGEAINAVEGKLEYDPKELEILSTDKSSSVLTSWTIAPTYSNENGELSFAGLLSTSTVLTRGEVLKFTVKSLRTGELHIRFATGAAVHAADGTGGNILSQLSGGVYVTRPKETDPTVAAASITDEGTVAGEVLGAATGTSITSTTHPDQESWYATSTAVLDWGIPAGTASILLSLDKRQNGEGVNPYSADTHEKVIRDIKDGIWYFHVTRIDRNGERDTNTYRIAVDTTLPTGVTASETARTDASEPNIKIQLTATDTVSGIDHYVFQLDQGGEIVWTDDGTHTKSFQGVAVGVHELEVYAVDKAGNRTGSHVQFTIENLPTPALTVMNGAFIEGDKLRLTLTSVPNATLDIHIARRDTSPSTEEFALDAKGKGIFESAIPLQPGSYTVSAIAHTQNGALSKESESSTFEVNSSFVGVMKRHPMIPVALLGLIALLALAWYYWKNMFGRGNESDDQPEVDESDFEETIQEIEEVSRKRVVQGGTVVLEKKKRIEMPATRL